MAKGVSVVSARHQFVKELASAAESVAYATKIIVEQQRRVARLKCKGRKADHAEYLLEIMLERRSAYQDFHNELLLALLTSSARPAMGY